MSVPEIKGPLTGERKPSSALSAFRQWTRPAFGAAFVLFFSGLAATILVMLWTKAARISEVSDIIITMLGMGGLVLGVYTAGRSAEKWRGVEGYPNPPFVPPYRHEGDITG